MIEPTQTNSNSDIRPPSKRARAYGFGAILVFLLAFALFFKANFRTVQVSGRSMMPTLKDGSRLLISNAYWLIGGIRHEDIIVIHREGADEYVIKRVYKKAGETVDWLNVPKNYPFERGPFLVPKDMIYVIGDNRGESEDSRTYGAVPVDSIIGKAVIAN